jgi:hypothetical protein
MNQEDIMQNRVAANKHLLYIILFIFIIGFFYIISTTKNTYLSKYLPKQNKELAQDSNNNDMVSIQSFNPLKDSQNDNDGDGIENWREVTIGTDPDVANSLPDGISTNNETEKISPTTNLTNSIGRDLYVISQYKKNDPNLNTDVMIDALNENLLDAIKPERVDIINLTDDNSMENIKNYGEKMAAAHYFLLPANFPELQELKDEKGFPKTEAVLKNVTETCTQLKLLKDIPSSFASLHKDLIYNCESYQYIISGIIDTETDPVRRAISIKSYQSNFENKVSNLKAYTQKLLIEKKVSYKDRKSTDVTNIYYIKQ